MASCFFFSLRCRILSFWLYMWLISIRFSNGIHRVFFFVELWNGIFFVWLLKKRGAPHIKSTYAQLCNWIVEWCWFIYKIAIHTKLYVEFEWNYELDERNTFQWINNSLSSIRCQHCSMIINAIEADGTRGKWTEIKIKLFH